MIAQHSLCRYITGNVSLGRYSPGHAYLGQYFQACQSGTVHRICQSGTVHPGICYNGIAHSRTMVSFLELVILAWAAGPMQSLYHLPDQVFK
jgi:hypothetical protein